jgi:hypothetical protein
VGDQANERRSFGSNQSEPPTDQDTLEVAEHVAERSGALLAGSDVIYAAFAAMAEDVS